MRGTGCIQVFASAGLLFAFASATTAQTGPTVFAGFEHSALGTATLDVDPAFTRMLVDNLGSAGGGVLFQLDAEAGSIEFGDGIRGARPPAGSFQVQGQYRYGGGATGTVEGVATAALLDLGFDFGGLNPNSVHGVIRSGGTTIVEADYGSLVTLFPDVWPAEVVVQVDSGELCLGARWADQTGILLPDQQFVSADEVLFKSESGASLIGEELGQLGFEGFDLDQVQILGLRFFEFGDWYEITGDLTLTRVAEGHELGHALGDGPGGASAVYPPDPCLAPTRRTVGITTASIQLPAILEPETRHEALSYADLQESGLQRIPTHTKEWINVAPADPGMTILGGFGPLGATSWTVQVFDDGLLVDTETGLTGPVATTKDFVVQFDQSDWDFLRQRAAAQMGFGQDVEITLPGPNVRSVIGDRIHVIPEDLQIFPDCVEGAGIGVTKFDKITLERGITAIPMPPALVFGIRHRTFGDALLRDTGGTVELSNSAFGPWQTLPLAGGVTVPVAGVGGFRWELAGDLDPVQLPPQAGFGYHLVLDDASTAGLDVGIDSGEFTLAVDFNALGSPDADATVWLYETPVWTGVLTPQDRILASEDFNRVGFTEDADGIVEFDVHWSAPAAIGVGGGTYNGTRVSERLRHRDRAVSLVDFQALAEDAPGVQIGRASVRRHDAWLSAVGEVDFGDLAAEPLLVTSLDPLALSGVEVEAEPGARGHGFQIEIDGLGDPNSLDGDERLTLQVEEDDESAGRRMKVAPSQIHVLLQAPVWALSADFTGGAFTGFRVEAPGEGVLFTSATPSGDIGTSDDHPVSFLVRGVGEDLRIRMLFAGPTVVTPASGPPLTTTMLTVIATGSGLPALPGGRGQLLSQNVETLAIRQPALSLDTPPGDAPPTRRRGVDLRPPRPNPFNPRTEIAYEVFSGGRVRLAVFDLAGRRVRTLLDETVEAGPGTAVWTGVDDRDRPVASGTYLVRLSGPGGEAQEKVTLVR